MPYSRMGWPILSSVSLRISMGPRMRPMTSAVMAAITARKVRYWKTRRKPQSGFWACNHMARLSSMGASFKCSDHLFHLHEAGSFDQHGRDVRHSGLVVVWVDTRPLARHERGNQ